MFLFIENVVRKENYVLTIEVRDGLSRKIMVAISLLETQKIAPSRYALHY